MVASSGEILAANRPATTFLGKSSRELVDRSLTEFVTDSSEKVTSYLRACAQSHQMILGTLTISQVQAELVCRSKGAVIQPRSQCSPATIMLRLERRDSNQFVALNQKIQELSRENLRRQKVQAELAQSNEALKSALLKLQSALDAVQTEKMIGLGQMVAGIAHEINNPISFIHGNLPHAEGYCRDLLALIRDYQQAYPHPNDTIQTKIDELDLEFLEQDIHKLLHSMRMGSQRVSDIVKSLRNFSRLDEAQFKEVDIYEGLEATLMILESRLDRGTHHDRIGVIREYSELSPVHCSPKQLNQVFLNILNNAIDALDDSGKENAGQKDSKTADSQQGRSSEHVNREPPCIWIHTEEIDGYIAISIRDNGKGIPSHIHHRIFDPFFTTKPVGQGTGLGLSVSYQIIESHGGQIEVKSDPKKGAEFTIKLPMAMSQK